MQKIRETISMCPTCYKNIPAAIYRNENNGVFMKKECSEHGKFRAVVENDANFYFQCLLANAPTIYGGHFIDVTEKCNLQCKYCYYPIDNKKADRPMVDILQEVTINPGAERFILTGGEPLLRKDLSRLIEIIQMVKPVELLTNGTLLNSKRIDELKPLLLEGETMRVNLSVHKECDGFYINVLKNFRKKGLKLESVLFVIDELIQIDWILDFCDRWKDVICATRIKSATPIWADQKTDARIFVSDMLRYMKAKGAEIVWWRSNKVSFVTTELNGIFHMLVSWYDVRNIDLLDISCPPTYTAKTGEVKNIVTSMIINEGIDKGYLNGVIL